MLSQHVEGKRSSPEFLKLIIDRPNYATPLVHIQGAPSSLAPAGKKLLITRIQQLFDKKINVKNVKKPWKLLQWAPMPLQSQSMLQRKPTHFQ